MTNRFSMKFKRVLFIVYLIYLINDVQAYDILSNRQTFEPRNHYNHPPAITNLTTLVGKTVLFNCTLSKDHEPNSVESYGFKTRLNPTWLKADPIYDRIGHVKNYNTENIIVTRKGIIADRDHNKMKLISTYTDQILQISNVNINNEGKYVCREFNSAYDKLFYLNVYARVSGLNLQLEAPTKHYRSSFTRNVIEKDQNDIIDHKIHFNHDIMEGGSISIKENDVLTINCTVDVSKPAANISIWLSPNHRVFNAKNSKKIPLYKYYTIKNTDMTLKSIAIAKLSVKRMDNQKSIICVAENTALDEKWESKRTLNVLYAPMCSPYQKKVYHIGINQTVDLECRMTDANPKYLDFNWLFPKNQGHNDRTKSNQYISRVKWTPKHISDFGEIKCIASNGLDSGDCKMQLLLGGPPNPPHTCYHKENNKTIIIECLPGFDQGDPEVYFYLLKRKSNDVLVEYARKRDSCSFLISNLILEEHMNEFYVYSSNKYGNNREDATKIIIENKEFLLKNSKKLQDISDQKSKRLKLIAAGIIGGFILVSICCCMMFKCHKNNIKMKSYTQTSQGTFPRSNLDFTSSYKYSSHQNQYQTKSGIFIDNYDHNKKIYNEKYHNDTSSSEFDQENFGNTYDRAKLYGKTHSKSQKSYTPSLLNNIQDLDMSPKSKRLSFKEKAIIESGCSRSLTEETETDSDNYIKSDEFSELPSLSEDQKLHLYSPIKNHTIANTIKMNDLSHSHGMSYSSSSKPSMKGNVWYGNHTDDYSAVDRNLYNVERGFAINMNNSIERLGYKNSYSSDNNQTNSNIETNNEYRNYTDLLTESKDDYDEEREENKLFQWPQANLPQLYSNETISLDIDDDKIVGILV